MTKIKFLSALQAKKLPNEKHKDFAPCLWPMKLDLVIHVPTALSSMCGGGGVGGGVKQYSTRL